MAKCPGLQIRELGIKPISVLACCVTLDESLSFYGLQCPWLATG